MNGIEAREVFGRLRELFPRAEFTESQTGFWLKKLESLSSWQAGVAAAEEMFATAGEKSPNTPRMGAFLQIMNRQSATPQTNSPEGGARFIETGLFIVCVEGPPGKEHWVPSNQHIGRYQSLYYSVGHVPPDSGWMRTAEQMRDERAMHYGGMWQVQGPHGEVYGSGVVSDGAGGLLYLPPDQVPITEHSWTLSAEERNAGARA